MKKEDKVRRENIQKILDDAWLNVHIPEDKLFNPLEHIPEDYIEQPHLYISYLMTRPEYFSFICKEIFGITLAPIQCLVLKELWHRKFPMFVCTRGFSKTFLLGIYSLLRAILLPGRKIMLCGAGFRQSKLIFEYAENIWNSSPIFRDMLSCREINGPHHATDEFVFNINESIITAIPIGTGEKIRGKRAHDILSDEHASQSREIFETVIAGFGAVRSGPIEEMQLRASVKLAKQLGVYEEYFKDIEEERQFNMDNQIIFSGTAYYDFNHFADYWKRWRNIILSGGDEKKLQTIFGGEVPKNFNWKHYSIIRIPYELVPEGIMDDDQVARARATSHSGNYACEYGAVFSADSNGFFKRSLIEKCVVTLQNPITFLSGPAMFSASLTGDPNKQYVMGVDPAASADNFAIFILELNPDHRRIVYGWSTNKQDHKEKVERGLIRDNDYYSYCARKIRDLMAKFNIVHISMDSQGGGFGVMEALQDKDKIRWDRGEMPIYEIRDYEKPKSTDLKPGLHVVELIQFADGKWVSDANHALRSDFENICCIFPFFDPVTIGLSIEKDLINNRVYDTLENCVMEIEELKNELATIIMTETPSGRDKWDTPEIKLPGAKKGRMRKDRYSALVMANMSARELQNKEVIKLHETEYGGWADNYKDKEEAAKKWHGPAFITDVYETLYD